MDTTSEAMQQSSFLKLHKAWKEKIFTSGRALVATCHLFAVDKAVTLTQRTHVKMLKGESLNTYNQKIGMKSAAVLATLAAVAPTALHRV